jgi:hypothetical protein
MEFLPLSKQQRLIYYHKKKVLQGGLLLVQIMTKNSIMIYVEDYADVLCELWHTGNDTAFDHKSGNTYKGRENPQG